MTQSTNRLLSSLAAVLPLADRYVDVLKGESVDHAERQDVRVHERAIATARRHIEDAAKRNGDVPEVVVFMAEGVIKEVRCDHPVRMTVFDFSAPAVVRSEAPVAEHLPDIGFGTSAAVGVFEPKPSRKAMAGWLATALRHLGIK